MCHRNKSFVSHNRPSTATAAAVLVLVLHQSSHHFGIVIGKALSYNHNYSFLLAWHTFCPSIVFHWPLSGHALRGLPLEVTLPSSRVSSPPFSNRFLVLFCLVFVVSSHFHTHTHTIQIHTKRTIRHEHAFHIHSKYLKVDRKCVLV